MKWHIGCSGFHYREWKGVFYPADLPQRRWFEYYSERFDTLELNVTFYRFPQPAFLENWYRISPDHFSFAVKIPRLISHYKSLKDCDSLLDDFYRTIEAGLKDKLAAVLFQFPPSFSFSEERLQSVLAAARAGFRNVAEFRHASWWQKEVLDVLGEQGIIFSGISHPNLPDQPIVNTPIAYYRFHGVPRLYYSQYDNGFLARTADGLKGIGEAFVYFNNTAAVGAIENAMWLKTYVS